MSAFAIFVGIFAIIGFIGALVAFAAGVFIVYQIIRVVFFWGR